MENKSSKRVAIYAALIILVFIGGLITYFQLFPTPEPQTIQPLQRVEKETAQMEVKIEDINQADEAYLKKRYGKIDTLFTNCDPGMERKAIEARLACIRKNPKAERFWRDMQTAESELKSMLLKKDIQTLSKFLSCDAYDLTWYEMHCESDRREVDAAFIKHLLAYIEQSKRPVIKDSVWKQRTPDKRLYRNPRWVLRSRLISPDFKLIGPWKQEPHPTENHTLILLEQHLDGKIYIVGIPITGTFDQ